tara:strand:- start:428 stop:553 length:126 start_codon:yes stop_codon:yes gene_type:complete
LNKIDYLFKVLCAEKLGQVLHPFFFEIPQEESTKREIIKKR